MGKFIIMVTLSILLSIGVNAVLDDPNKKEEKEKEFFITAENGAIGCLSKGSFEEERTYYRSGNYAAAQKLIDDQICFFFPKGSKMFAYESTCLKTDKDNALYQFKPNEFLLIVPFLPCAAFR